MMDVGLEIVLRDKQIECLEHAIKCWTRANTAKGDALYEIARQYSIMLDTYHHALDLTEELTDKFGYEDTEGGKE